MTAMPNTTQVRSDSMAARLPLSWRQTLTSLALFTTAITGCTVGPKYQPPQYSLPEHWSVSPDNSVTLASAEIMDWWMLFDDDVLNRLIQRAMQSNLDLRKAEARIREARAERAVAAADLWPQIGLGGAYRYERKSQNRRPAKSRESIGEELREDLVKDTAGQAFATSFDAAELSTDLLGDALADALRRGQRANRRNEPQSLYELGFDASWELDLFGGARRRVEAVTADVEAAGEVQHEVLVTLLAEVARGYAEARGWQRRLAIAREYVHLLEETLRLTRAQRDGGLRDDFDVARAEAQLASAQACVPALEASFRQTVHRLSLLLAELPEATLAEFSIDQAIPTPPPEIPLGLPSDLLRRRPDIRREERRLAAATARTGVATADLFPKFSLNGSFGPTSYDLRRLLDGRSLAWSVGPGVDWPLFDGGRTRANIAAHQAMQDEALAQYQHTVLSAVIEVEDALVAYQRERIRYEYLAAAAEANRQAVALAEVHYQEGIAEFLVVADAQRNLYAAQEALVLSRTNTTVQAIAIFKALGGGWEAPQAPATTAAERDGGKPNKSPDQKLVLGSGKRRGVDHASEAAAEPVIGVAK